MPQFPRSSALPLCVPHATQLCSALVPGASNSHQQLEGIHSKMIQTRNGGQKQSESPGGRWCCSTPSTSHGADMVEIQNSRWLFWVGFFGSFFPFSLSHFQGNKTRCHLLVAIAISPDSASAAEEEKSRESAVLPRSPELLRPELWGEHGSMGLYPTEAMGRFTGSKEGAAGFLEHKSALLLTASVPARCAAHLGTSPWSAYRGGWVLGVRPPPVAAPRGLSWVLDCPPPHVAAPPFPAVLVALGGMVGKHSYSGHRSRTPQCSPAPHLPHTLSAPHQGAQCPPPLPESTAQLPQIWG